jgi:O-antigen ligase
MLCIASKPLAVWFQTGVKDLESGSPLDRAFLTVLLFSGLFILALRKFSWSRAIKEHAWLMLLIGYMLVSIFWSEIPFMSFKRWIKELVAVVMAFVVQTEQYPRQALESLFRRTVYILIPFSLLLIKYFSKYGREYDRWSGQLMWVGVTLQKNGLGRLCIISGFFLIWRLVRRWQGSDIPASKFQTHADVLVLILTLWLLKGPPGVYPATATIALAAGLAAFVGLLWMKKGRINLGANTLTAIMVLVIAFGTVTPFVGGSTVGGFTSPLGRDDTLTGRTDIWAGLLPIVMRQPILGCGFGGFWTTETRKIHNIDEAHNGYLDGLLELGFVGLLLLSMFLLSSCRKAHRELTHDFYWASLWICYLFMAVVHNVAESSINSLTNHMTAGLIFLAICSTAASRYAREFHEKCDIS